MEDFMEHLMAAHYGGECHLHFLTVREMTNIVLAACEGKQGDPTDFKDYRLRLFS